MEMGIVCWCGSGVTLSQCHGQTDNSWSLPAVADLRLKWPEGADSLSRHNCQLYIRSYTPYTCLPNGDYLGLASGPFHVEFFKQSLVATKEIYQRGLVQPIPIIPDLIANYNVWSDLGIDQNTFLNRNLVKLSVVNDISSTDGLRGFKQASSNIVLASDNADLARTLTPILRKFMELSSKGFVDLLTIDPYLARASHLPRVLAKQEMIGVVLTRELSGGKWFERIQSLAPYFGLMMNIFEVGFYGFVLDYIDKVFLFTFGEKVSFSDLGFSLAYVRGATANFVPSQINYEIPHFVTSPSGFRVFTHWYVNGVNRILCYLTHLATFAKIQGTHASIDTVKHYKHLLTFDQVSSLLLRMVTSDDYFTKSYLTLILLDILAHTALNKPISALFESAFLQAVIASLSDLPAMMRDKYTEYAETVFNTTIQAVYDGALPDLRVGDHVVADGRSLTKEQYTGEYLSALRHTIHGYSSNRWYEKLLFTNADKIPDIACRIPAILYVSMLCKPSLFFPSEVFDGLF